jgi:XTP/dITP diphosphohydrolase
MTVKMKLYVATGNAHKLKEISQILPGFEIVAENPGDVEENAPDFAGNALIKVRAIAGSRRGEWCMADDSGLEVEALGGEPGGRSARSAGGHGDTAANNELLLRNLEGVDNRAARFVCSIALVSPDGREFSVEGSCRGRIIESAAGAQGFGYDPLFVPEGYEQTFAELSAEEKNALSHRGRALAAARKVLKDNA